MEGMDGGKSFEVSENPKLDTLVASSLVGILNQLDAQSLVTLQMVNTQLRRASMENEPWRNAFKRSFPYKYDYKYSTRSPETSWMTLYKRQQRCENRWSTGTDIPSSIHVPIINGPVFGISYLEGNFFTPGHVLFGGVIESEQKGQLAVWDINFSISNTFDEDFNQQQVNICPRMYQVNQSNLGDNNHPHDRETGAHAFAGGVFSTKQRPGSNEIICTTFGPTISVVRLHERKAEKNNEYTDEHNASSSVDMTMHTDGIDGDINEFAYDHIYTLLGHSNGCSHHITYLQHTITASFDGTLKLFTPPPQRFSDEVFMGPPEHVFARQTFQDDIAHSHIFGTTAATMNNNNNNNNTATRIENETHLPPVCSVDIDSTMSRMVSGGNDMILKLWDVETARVLLRLSGHQGWIWNLHSMDDGLNCVLSTSTDGYVRTWDMRGSKQIMGVNLSQQYRDDVFPVSAASLRSDGRYIIASCFDSNLYVIDTRMQRILHSLHGHDGRISRLLLHNDDTAISTGFDGSARLFSFDR